MSEIENIHERYGRRQEENKSPLELLFSQFIVSEREEKYDKIIHGHFKDVSSIKILEIGAGGGGNIPFFIRIGVKPENIYANELLPERVEMLGKNHPDIHILSGDAMKIDETEKFDIVFQSTVFTSILDDHFRKELAAKMARLVKKEGMILWYDFVYDNPDNKDVKKVTAEEVKKLFADAKDIKFHRVTLAPPIGRRVGSLYPVLNALPFLRTHLIVVLTFS